MQIRSVRVLKGGSLGVTELIETQLGELRVRKSISALVNREYGEVRWHSQFKRLQRYSALIPELFPKVLELGVNRDSYYFDIEYFDGYVNLKTYFCEYKPSAFTVEEIALQVLGKAKSLHNISKLEAYPGSLAVYLQEEVFQKLTDAREDKIFRTFTDSSTVHLNAIAFPSFLSQAEWLQAFVSGIKVEKECFTHGNLTLENILIHPETLDVRFIDPYDENIVDCQESDFSQIMQCSRSHYGIMSDSEPMIDGTSVIHNYVVPSVLLQFDDCFAKILLSQEVEINEKLLDFLHFSQFIRMLPFKIQAQNRNMAILFYTHSCKLLDEMRKKYGN
jgi:hypothetical protein